MLRRWQSMTVPQVIFFTLSIDLAKEVMPSEAENIDMEDVWEDDGDEDDTDAEESSDENDLDYGR